MVLMLVIGLILVMARLARRYQVSGVKLAAKPVRRVEVVSRQSLGKHSALVLVRVANRTLLVGQSAQQLTLLSELEDDPVDDSRNRVLLRSEEVMTPGTALEKVTPPVGAWDAFVDRLRELTVRR